MDACARDARNSIEGTHERTQLELSAHARPMRSGGGGDGGGGDGGVGELLQFNMVAANLIPARTAAHVRTSRALSRAHIIGLSTRR